MLRWSLGSRLQGPRATCSPWHCMNSYESSQVLTPQSRKGQGACANKEGFMPKEDFMSPQGAVLSHNPKSSGQSKCAMLLRCVDMRRLCVPWGCRSDSAPGLNLAAPAAVAQFLRSLIRSRRRSKISRAQPRAAISAQRDVILGLNIDIEMLTDSLFAFGI